MRLDEVMTPTPATCGPDDSLEVAARLLWELDVGVVPVVRGDTPVGMLTDRDVCMAAYTQGKPLRELTVAGAMSKAVVTVRRDEPPDVALARMREHRVRRLPVVDERGALAGLVSLCDLARTAEVAQVVVALTAISAPRTLAPLCLVAVEP